MIKNLDNKSIENIFGGCDCVTAAGEQGIHDAFTEQDCQRKCCAERGGVSYKYYGIFYNPGYHPRSINCQRAIFGVELGVPDLGAIFGKIGLTGITITKN